MSLLQVSLYVAGCCFASLSRGITTLRHNQLPDCIGCLLSGSLIFTSAGIHLHRNALGSPLFFSKHDTR
jgi:hypothetical protein